MSQLTISKKQENPIPAGKNKKDLREIYSVGIRKWGLKWKMVFCVLMVLLSLEVVVAFTELTLRKWIKDLMGHRLEWVEPTMGSSVGIPDALIAMPDKTKLPVELKLWRYTQRGFQCKMRPAQIRYHYMTWYRKKGKTAICFAVESKISAGVFHIYVLNGKDVPRDQYHHEVGNKCILICKYNEHVQQKD